MKVLADAFVHLDFRRMDLVIPESENDGIAAALALEQEKVREESDNQVTESTQHGAKAMEAILY
jgi:hypothetical protein